MEFIQSLEVAAGQAWLDGAKSVVDQRYNNATDRLPLWTISFWKEMAAVHKLQTRWTRGMSWLQQQKTKHQDKKILDLTAEAVKILDSLPWNAPMPYGHGGGNTCLLSWFLETEWLSDEHIDMMMEDLAMEMPPTMNKTQIAILAFLNEVRNLVFGSLVWSSFLTPRAINRNCNQSFYFWFLKKTGPN